VHCDLDAERGILNGLVIGALLWGALGLWCWL
jgi:hypothetical protein